MSVALVGSFVPRGGWSFMIKGGWVMLVEACVWEFVSLVCTDSLGRGQRNLHGWEF